jgi:hypothetical protein
MKAHQRQFVIGNLQKQVNEDWKAVQLSGGLILSYCPQLSVATAKDLNGEVWHLLGLAVQTDKKKSDPITEITHSSTGAVRDIYKSWSGKWMLIGAGEVHLDCCGLLGCFYTSINGARWVSGSLAILQEIGGFTPRPETLTHRKGLEWYPPPTTRFEGVSKLLPSQILNLKTFGIEARGLPKPIPGLPYDAMIDQLAERIKFGLENACRPAKRVFTQLTAGYDSRLVLAAIRSLGIKAEAYTTESYYIAYADVTLPPKLAKLTGYRHRYIKRGPYSKEKEALYDYHTARNCGDIDRAKYAEGQWDPFGKGDLILRGGIFEAGRCEFWKKLGGDFTVQSVLKGVRQQYDPESFIAKAFSEWMKWVDQTPTEGLDWRDRFYIEQRVTGWLSAIEQSLDLTGTDRFNVANCHDIISLMLSAPVEKRKGFVYYVYLIRKLYPALLKYPFNPPEPKFKKLQKRLIESVRCLYMSFIES